MSLSITFTSSPSTEDLKVLTDGIDIEALEKRNMPPTKACAFFLRDEKGTVMGGINGFVFFGSLYIDQLFVDKQYRKKGYGKALIENCEAFAKAENCSFITANTMDFQALPFYMKLGFFVEAKREGYLHNSISYFLRKNL